MYRKSYKFLEDLREDELDRLDEVLGKGKGAVRFLKWTEKERTKEREKGVKDGWMDGWIDGWMDRRMDGWKE